MVLDREAMQEKIVSLTSAFQTASTREAASNAEIERRVNKFLDAINNRKQYLRETADNLSALFPKLSELSWCRGAEADAEAMEWIGKIVDLMDKMAAKMIRRYAETNAIFHKKGIDKTELRRYKEVADTMKEMAVDLHNRFYVFPQDAEMQDLISQFADL